MSGPIEMFGASAKQRPVLGWVDGVEVDHKALLQAREAAALPFIFKHVALMPDVHLGIGATIGSVIPTKGAVVPAAVGVDLGCGMSAVRLPIDAERLPDNLLDLRLAIETRIPKGFESTGDHFKGGWEEGKQPKPHQRAWRELSERYERLVSFSDHQHQRPHLQMGSLGGGNHFIEVCLDKEDGVWVVLHSGSRGPGNKVGTFFIELAKRECERRGAWLPNRDLAYLNEGTPFFDAYVAAVTWAQDYARINRDLMMGEVLDVCAEVLDFEYDALMLAVSAVNCHHNYIEQESHFGERVWVTRKGAVRAGLGDLGIIPGSMGERSYIVRGLGNPQSFNSCSHGAGRLMSRGEAKRRFTQEDLVDATKGVECRKDAGVIDEIPYAYKPIETVMAAQADLVEVVHELRQVLNIKG